MKIDPRNPDPNHLVSPEEYHVLNPNRRRTLTLLKFKSIYFVIEGWDHWPQPYEELQKHNQYFYEEHQCPTNFIAVQMIIDENGNVDPHRIFEFVETVWMTTEYDGSSEYLFEVFSILKEKSNG
jgi:hypothetical protein